MKKQALPLAVLLLLVAHLAAAQTDRGPYARLAFLRAKDGNTADFEAGYIRHLDWHRNAKDAWTWYGWTVWAGERQRWLVYATFGHPASAFDAPVSPAEDERDTLINVIPHSDFTGNGLYEFLPALSHADAESMGEPSQTPRAEMTTVELAPGTEKAFEAALIAAQPKLHGETLWYRMIAGGAAPRYVRLRPRASIAAIASEASDQALPESVNKTIVKTTIEILTLRPTMSIGVTPIH